MSYELSPDKFLSDAELAELNRVLAKYASPRDRLLIETALACGMRACEVLAVHAKHLDPENKTLTIQGRKRGRKGVVALKAKDGTELAFHKQLGIEGLFERLAAACNEAPNGKPFDISMTRLVQIWDSLRPNKFKGFHTLRHTFALKLLKKCKNVKMVQTGLRHKALSSTMVYTDYVESTEGLQGAME